MREMQTAKQKILPTKLTLKIADSGERAYDARPRCRAERAPRCSAHRMVGHGRSSHGFGGSCDGGLFRGFDFRVQTRPITMNIIPIATLIMAVVVR